jgi:hypothetical protein
MCFLVPCALSNFEKGAWICKHAVSTVRCSLTLYCICAFPSYSRFLCSLLGQVYYAGRSSSWLFFPLPKLLWIIRAPARLCGSDISPPRPKFETKSAFVLLHYMNTCGEWPSLQPGHSTSGKDNTLPSLLNVCLGICHCRFGCTRLVPNRITIPKLFSP